MENNIYLVVGNNTTDGYQLYIEKYDGYSRYQEYTGAHGCIEGEFNEITKAVEFCKNLADKDKDVFVVTREYSEYFND